MAALIALPTEIINYFSGVKRERYAAFIDDCVAIGVREVCGRLTCSMQAFRRATEARGSGPELKLTRIGSECAAETMIEIFFRAAIAIAHGL